MFRRIVIVSMVALMGIVAGAVSADAEEKPIQLSLLTPIQIFPETTAITGIRINLLYGRNTTVTGLDWGLINHTTAGESLGWQVGFVGYVEADFRGFQDNSVNVTMGTFTGLQAGFYNHAKELHGLQFGLVNYTESGRGLQIGLVNIIGQGGVFPVLPIVNWSF